MSEAILVNALEQLVPFLNEKNVLELVVRGNNKRIKAFQKVALDGLAHGEEQALVNKAIHALNANTGMAQRSLQLVQDVTKMQQLGLVLNGLNLCATCAGFAVMYAKLDSMSTEINRQFLQLQNMMKQGHDLQASYEFDKVLSEHTNMMDCRKTKKPYSEEKMRELVDAEYNVLKLLTGVAEKGLAADHQNMILSIFSMLSMFTVSLCYFDEQYYFNNRSALGDKEIWHSSHQNWMSVYDKLSSPWFIEMLQDYAMFETKLDTLGVDVYYLTLVEQIRDLREKVEDNQELIIALGDIELLHSLHEAINANDKEFVKKLAFLAYNSNTYQVRMYGVFLFGYLSEQNDILTFMRDEVSKDDNWRVQEVLAKAFDEFCKNTGYEKALPIIDEWLENDNPNTRRAVTEGLRIWTSRPYFKDNPNEAIRRIVALKEDPSEYVRKSVGNALRDISKKFPELIKDELNNWKLESKEINQVYKLASKLIN